MRSTTPARRLLALATGSVLAVSLAACGGDSGDSSSGGGGGGTLVFGASADPVTLDGAYVSDGESLRPIRQIFEGLVTTKAGGTDVEPRLAKSWKSSPDGKAWTFTLQDGVKFHDGTPFNADAVCVNFDRWYNFKGIQQSASVSYYWQSVFGGYATHDDKEAPTESLYKSCEAKDDTTAVINLTKASSSFLAGLSLPSFSIASPDALQKYEADKVAGDAAAPRFTGSFGDQHPVGTGPFKFGSWARGDKLEIVRNDDYWGDKSKLEKVIFKPIPDGNARRQALEAGDIDGYDLVSPGDVESLRTSGDYEVLDRPAFNVAYIGFNLKRKPLDNPKIRQAIAYAVDKSSLLKAKYPAGAQEAVEFMPPELFGYSDSVEKYSYDPDKAKQLISESGVANPTLEFWYPTGVSRPYMPSPVDNFQAIKANLEAVGFKIVPKAAKWDPDYLNAVDSGKTAVHLIGWTGDFGDPDNFIGVFFQQSKPQFGIPKGQDFQRTLDAAEQETDQNKRVELYKQANDEIMKFLPGVPYAHTQPQIAFIKGVTGYVPSPVNNEDFDTVELKKG